MKGSTPDHLTTAIFTRDAAASDSSQPVEAVEGVPLSCGCLQVTRSTSPEFAIGATAAVFACRRLFKKHRRHQGVQGIAQIDVDLDEATILIHELALIKCAANHPDAACRRRARASLRQMGGMTEAGSAFMRECLELRRRHNR